MAVDANDTSCASSTDAMKPTHGAAGEQPQKRKTICRVVKRQHYTQLPNALLRDKGLSLQARGLLAFILSFPDDWEFGKEWLMKEANVKRTRLEAAIIELDEAGYCKRDYIRDEAGRVTGYEYLFCEERQPKAENLLTEPKAGKPKAENRQQTNTIEREKDCQKKNTPLPSGEGAAQAQTPPAPEAKPDPDARVIDLEAVEVQPASRQTNQDAKRKPSKKGRASPMQPGPDLLGDTIEDEREVKFPRDWVRDEAVIKLGASCGLTEARTRAAFDRLQDWFTAGKGKREKRTMRQWFKRAEIWFRKDAEGAYGSGRSNGRAGMEDVFDNLRAQWSA
jgi:hypothetical protein